MVACTISLPRIICCQTCDSVADEGHGLLFLLSTLTQPILLKANLKEIQIISEYTGGVVRKNKYFSALGGCQETHLFFDVPVEALSWQQRQFIKLPTVQKKI